MLLRLFKWLGSLLLLLILLLILVPTLWVALFGWNGLRQPVARLVMEKTGRELVIGGDVQVGVGWPLLHVQTSDVTFANPAWAREKYMLKAEGIDFSLDLPALIGRHLAMDVLALRQASIFLEINAAGQKNWLLDLDQKDESARLLIGRLALEQSRVFYSAAAEATSVAVDLSTREIAAPGGADAAADVIVRAEGRYRGMPLVARGSGGPVLALRDERHPYPFKIDATIGHTGLRAEGTVTSLSKLTALDASVALHGDSLAQLFPLLGAALPETRAYQSAGRVTHQPGVWRYQGFSARIGNSDFSGTLQVETGGRRPVLRGDLVFGKLEFADLGPVVGTRRGDAAPLPASRGNDRHVLPQLPFRVERWKSLDADVKLTAKTILRARELPIDNLATRLRMQDAVLTLDPLQFGVAGGTFGGAITLDGQHDPIRAHARLAAKKIVFARLFPSLKLNKANVGQVSAEVDLAGTGNAVADMLASANGRVGLVIAGGEVSKLMMEMAGLHLLEVITLKIAGDRPIKIRCLMADFQVRQGVMAAEQLLFDTEISTIDGHGRIDLGQEKLDLTLLPKSKKFSLIALRSPIYVRGSFARPVVDVDKGRIAARGLGALALGVANPLLAMVPLIEAGPGMESDCGRLIGAGPAGER